MNTPGKRIPISTYIKLKENSLKMNVIAIHLVEKPLLWRFSLVILLLLQLHSDRPAALLNLILATKNQILGNQFSRTA